MDFLLLGNDPFLDFVNTRPFHDGQFIEQIGDGASLLNLMGRLELDGVPRLREGSTRETDSAAADARQLREEARSLLFRLHDGAEPEFSSFNKWLTRHGNYSLAVEHGRPILAYHANPALPEARWLAPLLAAGVKLLSSPKAGRIRKCANPECVLWYLDTTKSGTRRWCSMATCGNVDKARNFRQRLKTEKNS